MAEETHKNPLYCSFCGKNQYETRKLIAGPTVFICGECVALCIEIISENKPEQMDAPLREWIKLYGGL